MAVSDRIQDHWKVWTVHQFLRITRVLKKPPPPIDFQQAFASVKRILVVLPDDTEMCTQLASLTSPLKELFQAERQDYAIPKHLQDRVTGGNIWGYSLEQKTFLGLPDKELVRKIKRAQYDMAISLSTRFDLYTFWLCLETGSPLRVSFQAPHADNYFNMIIQPVADATLSSKLSSLLKYLRLMLPHA